MRESKSRVSFASSLGTFESFKRRNYRYLWLGTYSAAFGVWLHQASLGWFVFEITDSPFLVGVVVATRNVPFVIAGLGGGLAADRFNRRALLALMHILISIWALLFSITILFGLIGALDDYSKLKNNNPEGFKASYRLYMQMGRLMKVRQRHLRRSDLFFD